MDILEWYYSQLSHFNAITILIMLGISLVLSVVIFFVYRFTYSGANYNSKFNFSNMIIMLVATTVMIMISTNIAVALGMVGALSIIRFRTAIKDPRDGSFIFWSLIAGLCVGIQAFELAIISTFVISAVMLASKFFIESDNRYFLIIRGTTSEIHAEKIKTLLERRYSYQAKIKTVTTSGDLQEIIFETRIKKELNLDVVNSLLKLDGIQDVNWVSTTGETVS